ncbi:hypothetical protein PINS_up016272 [Pythium insidiosum]|nr:hypothetical protein PINS_up016272 [Pythium insidiosum]
MDASSHPSELVSQQHARPVASAAPLPLPPSASALMLQSFGASSVTMPATAARPQPSSSSSSSTGRPSRRSKDRGARFIDKHALKYGLSICSRSATDNSVEMVMCKFCVAFGKESATDPTRKRRATANIKYFRQPFRADHYLSHLEINHKSKWAEYERASAHEKEQFFFSSGANGALHDALSLTNHEDVAVGAADVDRLLPLQPTVAPSANMAPTTGVVASPTVVGSVRLPVSEIEREMVEGVIAELFYDPIEETSVTREQALDVFVAANDDASFSIVIKNQRLYDLAVKFVASGASYRLASRLVQCTKEETKLSVYGGCSDARVAGFVRAVIASNLQRVAWMMRGSWTYSIVTETATHDRTLYLDIRLRVWHNSALRGLPFDCNSCVRRAAVPRDRCSRFAVARHSRSILAT